MNILNKTLLVLGTITLTACSSTGGGVSGGKIVLEEEYYPISRDEIIIGIQECENSGARPVLQKARVKMAGRNTDVVIGVTCSPRFDKNVQYDRGYLTGYEKARDRYHR